MLILTQSMDLLQNYEVTMQNMYFCLCFHIYLMIAIYNKSEVVLHYS